MGKIKKKYAFNFDKGFTLIELLVVMVIIALLGSLVTMKVVGQIEKANINAAKTQIEMFKGALSAFRIDAGRYPTTNEGLIALRKQPCDVRNWEGPYIDEQLPLDPWDNKYHYRCPGDKSEFELISYGADGQQGGEEKNQDIVSWRNIGQSDEEYY